MGMLAGMGKKWHFPLEKAKIDRSKYVTVYPKKLPYHTDVWEPSTEAVAYTGGMGLEFWSQFRQEKITKEGVKSTESGTDFSRSQCSLDSLFVLSEKFLLRRW